MHTHSRETTTQRIFSCLGAILLILALAALPACLSAQVGTATVTGTVMDATGAILPGAGVTLKDMANGTTRTMKADSRGFFSFQQLPAATYEVLVQHDGFNSVDRRNIAVHIGDNLDVPELKLTPAGVDQTVTVTAEDESIVPTTTGESAYTLSSKQIQNLNIEGRNAIELLGLVPGAANSGNFESGSYSGQTAGFSQNASGYSVNGNRFDLTQIVSDGATVTDVNTAGSAAVTPNVDMISEAKVETAAFLPENPNGPIVVNTETKSGGSSFHGELYAQVRNHVLDDTDWRVKNLGVAKPSDAYYYPGANISGPVLLPGGINKNRDKLFFFVAFEKALQYVQDPLFDIREAVTPTAAMRTGDFSNSAYLASISGPAYYASVTPCTPAGSNTSLCQGTTGLINPAAIDPNGKILLNALPQPNANPPDHGRLQPDHHRARLSAARPGEPQARLQHQSAQPSFRPLQSRV
jgi:hypothetical protein